MNPAKKVLIFRTGSLGDTTVALPSFHLIAKAFPAAERRVLTSISPSEHAVPLSDLLDPTGLVHGYMIYPFGRLNMKKFIEIRQEIREWKPDLLIYLAEPRGPLSAWRDAIFFKSCGIKKLIGIPYTKLLRENQWLPQARRFEHESERLMRCLNEIGTVSLDDPKTWDLKLTGDELKRASRCLEDWKAKDRFIVCNVSAKVKAKDWGEKNWEELFKRLSASNETVILRPEGPKDLRFFGLRPQNDEVLLGVVMIGAKPGALLSEKILKSWKGPKLNLCGKLSLRESAAVMKRALFYLGHDSGPMHLAAAVGIPCVAIFVECKKPNVWFPYGSLHQVIYHTRNGKSPTPVHVDEVFSAVQKMIRKND